MQEGTLALTGNNTNFNGSVVVDPDGTLEARAQSLPPSVTNNGLVRFVQPDAGTYAGVISGTGRVAKTDAGVLTLTGVNTYQGGTTIQGGTVAVGADNRLGANSGGITLDGGTLQLTSSFNLSAARAITVTANNGTIQTDTGVTSTISQGITGAGMLTKAGPGTLILTGSNTYGGGTTISGGTLQLGNGATTGSIVGDVANNGTLVFDRSDSVTFGGTISGSGSVVHSGPGVTMLTGDNSYSGPTTISDGWLYVDGNQNAATGPTTAASGTRLGGSGTVGGNVTIADGATLGPGTVPLTPATPTINGNLTLNPDSELLYNLVEANVAGGGLNDLTVVQGNLVLDGTINVADQGQTFGPGVYRIINYGGTLTNNGLTIGSVVNAPATPQDPQTVVGPLTGFSVQTSIPGQVNLVNTTGLSLTYWDGDAFVNENNNVIDGTVGTWRNAGSAATDNWTDANGAVNSTWEDGGFAIFAGAPAVVTVNSDTGDAIEQVRASGMQFMVDGYTITGDPLELVSTGFATIRVGDGTLAGAAVTASIEADLTGAAALRKDDLGTLILSGDNTYTGFTSITGGTLQISADNNLGAAGFALFITNGSTLRTTDTFATSRAIVLSGASGGRIETESGTLTVDGVISQALGSAPLVKDGGGTLVLTGANTYSGGTTIEDGILQLGTGGATGSILGDVQVLSGGTLAFNRSDTYVFDGAVSGAGGLHQIGGGTTVLTADSTYGGGTTITSGTLQLGDGGTSGGIVGDVTSAAGATLVFDRSDQVTFSGTISGGGSVIQTGPGVTILTADNSYAGSTTISDGWLYVDGDQSAATGPTTAAAGTRLGGSGTIGGNVAIGNDATLSPGAMPLNPATLTINGNLTLNSGSILFYNMVEANVAGGALNDLTEVEGNLVLDGVINIVDPGPGQTLGPGVYRIINYSGTLTNNGLTVGSYMTAAATPQETPVVTGPMTGFSVQTSIPGQVNLVNTAGLTLSYWDVGPKNNGVIDGGTGTWQASPGTLNDNWTGPDGTINAPWADGAYAIFMATPGTVTVDNSEGTVTASGMQFASDGYLVTGEAITLLDSTTGNVTFIRVGDGTPIGTAMTATIQAELTGAAAVIKDDLGTLVLSGANTYTNGTGIFGGTLQIAADANLGAATGNLAIINGSTLRTTATFATSRMIILGSTGIGTSGGRIETAAATQLTVNGAIVEDPTLPPSSLVKAGDGSLILTAANTYGGSTTIEDGILQLGDGGATGSILGDVEALAGTTLAFNRSDTYVFDGVVSGDGELHQIGAGATVLTGDSTYSGGTTISGGTLQLGDGGMSGGVVGDVANDGTLVFDRSDGVTFGGTISGSGSVVQAGPGVTILTADNSYTGLTTISDGTLQLGDGGTAGSIVGDVANDGTLAFNRSDIYSFAGTISGTGTLEQIGAGTTVLTADNTYTGGTTISAGALQIGDGGNSGSIVGDVTNNGVLAVNRSDDVTLDGRIFGSGSLVQQGSGTTILTGNSTYSGGTTISAGTLQLGDGGTSGSIIGDILNDGTLAFDHADLLPIVGTISGSGNLVQRGNGTAVLLGDNSYTGPTSVDAGALYINGDQSAATGPTAVASGATLGGNGTVGGNVIVAGGGMLSPGDVGVAPGTLTINGDLELNDGAILTYQFGQAGVVGGALNDLTVVAGDLVLAGTLNVETAQAGSFDPGVYRVITYAGSFTDNGLTIGSIPSPDFFLQTNVPNQVNLINTAGMTFNYWDGDAGPKHDGVIDGGDGVWQHSAGNDNWTNELGVPNAPWDDAAFAIFMGQPGTVTIDNSLGNVEASGMQFMVDGYEITGETLTLVASPALPDGALIRVGDGTDDGAGYTATISSVVAGDTALVKSDLGTLVLAADNTYTGGTVINGGAVQISSDANLGAAGSPLSLDGGTLRVIADVLSNRPTTLGEAGGTFEVMAGAEFTQESAIAGTGSLTKSGDGAVILTADNSYEGPTIISAGILQLGDGGTSGNIAGNVVNDGALVFNRSDTMVFEGAIAGFGSVMQAGAGTTILTADSTYEGGTTISAGTLQFGDGGTTGSIVGDVANDGTLAFNRGDTLIFQGDISGAGAVDQIGSGTTILTGANTYSGPSSALAGTLQAGAANTFSPNSQFSVSSGATLDLAGFDQTIAGLTNAGLVRTGGAPGSSLTVAGNYVGANGLLALNTYLGDDSSASDRLVIDGGAASGTTAILIANVGGAGAQTTGDGILVIAAVNGGTTTPGAFSLEAPVVAGPYEYSLYRSGAGGGSPEDWFLRSTIDCTLRPDLPVCAGVPPPAPPADYRPETSLYPAIPSLALDYGNTLLGSLDERMGGQRSFRQRSVGAEGTGPSHLAWGRIIGQGGSRHGGALGIHGNDGPSYDYHSFALQTGMDLYRAEHPGGGFRNAGVYFAYGRAHGDVAHFDGVDAGSLNLSGITLGGYWTHYGSTGWYLDGVIQATWYDIEASGRLPKVSTDGFGFGASLETGYPFRFENGVVLEPQAQITYQTINLGSMRDVGADIRFDDVQSLVGRVGVRLSQSWDLRAREDGSDERRQAVGWIRASLVNEFLGEPAASFSSQDGYVPFQAGMKGAGFKIDAGFDAEFADDVSVYGSIDFQRRFDGDSSAFGGKLGLKVRF